MVDAIKEEFSTRKKQVRHKCNRCDGPEKLAGLELLKNIAESLKEPVVALQRNLHGDWEQIWASYEGLIEMKELFDTHPCEKIQGGLQHLFNNNFYKISMMLQMREYYKEWKRDIAITINQTNAQIENILTYEDIFLFKDEGFGDFADLAYPAMKDSGCNPAWREALA